MIDPNMTVSRLMSSTQGFRGPGSVRPGNGPDVIGTSKAANSDDKKTGFADAIRDYISKVDDLQQSSDTSIADLLSGKSEDIASVVSAAAKADMSFKLLVGVRNKLIEAYKQTMSMPL
jgi:flagellar hook-basal body complex protein FliE